MFQFFYYRAMAALRTSLVALVLIFGCVRVAVLGSSAPTYCTYVETENHFECDYDMMSNPADRPIDFTQFDPEPQRLTLYVNGYIPYFGVCLNVLSILVFQYGRC